MKHTATAALLALTLLLSATTAQAAPFDELEGQWVGLLTDIVILPII